MSRDEGEIANVRVIRAPSPLPLSALPAEPGEEWRYLPWTDEYAVSSHGRVCRTVAANRYHAGRLLKGHEQRTAASGRITVNLYGEQHGVAQLVAAAFLPPGAPDSLVAHKDNDWRNNWACNLLYVTRAELMERLYDHGWKTRPVGDAHWQAKVTDAEADAIAASHGALAATDVATRYTISTVTVNKIRRGAERAGTSTQEHRAAAAAIAARARRLRAILDMDKTAFAARIGVSETAIRRWERGETPRHYRQVAERLDAIEREHTP